MVPENKDPKRAFAGPNYGYVVGLYERYQQNPESVDEATRRLFQKWQPTDGISATPTGIGVSKLIGVVNLAQAIRSYGYLAAALDPLSNHAQDDPILDPHFHGLDWLAYG